MPLTEGPATGVQSIRPTRLSFSIGQARGLFSPDSAGPSLTASDSHGYTESSPRFHEPLTQPLGEKWQRIAISTS